MGTFVGDHVASTDGNAPARTLAETTVTMVAA